MFTVHRSTFHDPERPDGIDNYTKDEVRGDFLLPPHKHLTPATVFINTFWLNDLPEAKDAIEG